MTASLRAGGWLLVAGSALYFVAGYVIARRNPALARADAAGGLEDLRTIGSHSRQWASMIASFAIAVALTNLGLAKIELALTGTDGSTFAVFGLLVFGVGSLSIVLGNYTFHVFTTTRTARAVAAGGSVPDWYEHRRRISAKFYKTYMVLAYAGLALFGGALLLSRAVPTWIGWFGVVTGALGAVTIIVGQPRVGGLVASDLPLWIHVVAGIIGTGLVLMR